MGSQVRAFKVSSRVGAGRITCSSTAVLLLPFSRHRYSTDAYVPCDLHRRASTSSPLVNLGLNINRPSPGTFSTFTPPSRLSSSSASSGTLFCGTNKPINTNTAMAFHSSARRGTDGVFAALTDERTQSPWITALERKRDADAAGSKTTPATTDNSERAEKMKKPKRMSDSYHSVILPLAQDPWLSDTYLNASGHIRLGSLFMDLDALAGVICYKHTGDDPSVANVTAAFDRIAIKNPVQQICDLELSGQVTYASGRSSMEISLQVTALGNPDENGKRPDPKPEDVLLESTCTMVALDAITKKTINVSPLLIETDEERRVSERGEQNKIRKQQLRETDLTVYTPNDEESELIHRIWKKRMALAGSSFGLPTAPGTSDGPSSAPNIVFMDSTKLQTASIMQPQYRNRHQFMIFGGFLLKHTFELAFCCAASFAHTRPSFVSLDPSTFRNPVPVGSVLYLTARVAYTDPQVVPDVDEDGTTAAATAAPSSTDGGPPQTRIQVRVDSYVRDVEHAESDSKPTGSFNYTFLVDKDITVLPQTYSEYMMYLDARRRAKAVDEQDRLHDGQSFWISGSNSGSAPQAQAAHQNGGIENAGKRSVGDRLRALSVNLTE